MLQQRNIQQDFIIALLAVFFSVSLSNYGCEWVWMCDKYILFNTDNQHCECCLRSIVFSGLYIQTFLVNSFYSLCYRLKRNRSSHKPKIDVKSRTANYINCFFNNFITAIINHHYFVCLAIASSWCGHDRKLRKNRTGRAGEEQWREVER